MLMGQAEQTVTGTLEEFGRRASDVESRVNGLKDSSEEVASAIAQVLVDLQFQDRVSQMLSHIRDDAGRLSDALRDGDLPDPQTWLSRLEKTYSTQEQEYAHTGVAATGPEPSNSVTFF
jgi:methyl-accepting chemotaxis protein